MVSPANVRVRLASITRAWRATDSNDVWILVKCRELPCEVLESVLDVLNARGESGERVLAEMAAPAPGGLVALLTGVEDRPLLANWLDNLAAELGELGVGADITAAPVGRLPDWMTAVGDYGPVPTAFVSWTVRPETLTPQARGQWGVAAGVTEAIGRLASDWARQIRGRLYLRQLVHTVELPDTDVSERLADGLLKTGMAGIDVTHDADHHGRHVSLDAGGEGTFQVIHDAKPFEECLQPLREAITALPAATNYAFVRFAPRYSLGLPFLDYVLKFPHVQEWQVRSNRHLLPKLAPDACAIQVLTDAHLEKVRDLTNWHVTALGHGRHLVEARDLRPWFAAPAPDAAVLAQARHDFEPMLFGAPSTATE